MRAALGPPDSATQAIPFRFEPKLEFLRYSDGGSTGHLSVTVVDDSLAYLSYANVGAGSLVTDRGQFELGAPLAEIREAFPESYACRDWRVGGTYQDRFDTVLAVTDTTRGAHVLLLFRERGLAAVATDYYARDSAPGAAPKSRAVR